MGTFVHIVSFHEISPEAIGSLLVIVALLVVSALISGSETAFFSLSPADVNSARERKSPPDKALIKLLGTQDYLLATILIANNLVNICIVIISNNFIDKVVSFGSTGWEFAGKVVVVTFVLLLFGEIIPKIFSAYYPLRFARFISVPLLGLKHFLKPVSYLLIKSGGAFNERLSGKKTQISIDELSDAIEITRNHTDEEKQMLTGIVSFVNTEVAEIMKPRMDMVAIDKASGFEAVKRVILDSGFSRIPVYEENIDTIVGILYVKDMISYISEPDAFPWQEHLRKPYFVPEHKKINDLMEEFQSGKVHMAIVVDEYGATQGLVSLEDILEEIVGEISDESDAEEPTFYKKIDDNNYIFDGKTHISDLEEVLGLGEDYFDEMSADIETVAGLVLELKHDFLQKGDSVTFQSMRFTVTSLDGRRIDKVKVTLIEPAAPGQ
ncbi:MAG: gliding motility-associated protein GldE [Rikenellaceae bacterium]|nr:gliding motility-associated protein GldE [Rikenellaceae bacterium]